MQDASPRVSTSAATAGYAPDVCLQMDVQHDGLVCTTYREGILVSGGTNMRLLWRFSFRSMEWSLLRSQGQFVPSGRLFHTASVWGDSLIVSGGVTIDAEDTLHVYRLDLISMRWYRIVPQFPEEDMLRAPIGRSHHAATVVGDLLYVHGGKPAQAGLTTGDYRKLHYQGFYDILIMHLPSGSWTRRAHSLVGEYVPAPPLWGHTMGCLGGSALVLFGGFEIDLALEAGEASYASREIFEEHLVQDAVIDSPSAELQNVINVFSLKTLRWSAFAPNVMTVGPRPRALHTMQFYNDREMVVIGGISLDDSSGALVPASDAWTWNGDTGVWKKLEPFPIPPFYSSEPNRFRGARVWSAFYNDQLVISNDVTTWHILDVADQVEYTSADTDESDYFHCACVDAEDWQRITNDPPQPYDNPLAQSSLHELASLLHPRRLHIFEPSNVRSHSSSSAARSSFHPVSEVERENALRKFLPFANGSRPSPDRQGQINPIIAALIGER